MSSYKKKQKNNQFIKNFLSLVYILLAVAVFGFFGKKIINKYIDKKPLLSESTIYYATLPRSTLIKKINELETTLESYKTQAKITELLNEENKFLKSQFNRSTEAKGTLAHVVTLPNRSLYNTFIIDAGENEGIEVDQIVYAFDAVALGTISAVEKNHATVLLFSAPGRSVTGTAGENNVAVTLIGRGSGEYEVRLPRDLSFTVGGLIAYQSTIPSVLAEVERIVTDPRDPFQRLVAKTPLNLQALKWVKVK